MGPRGGSRPSRGAPAVSGGRIGPLVGRLGASDDEEDGDEGDILGPWPGAGTRKLRGSVSGAGGAQSRAVWSHRGALARHVNPRAPGQGFRSRRGARWGSVWIRQGTAGGRCRGVSRVVSTRSWAVRGRGEAVSGSARVV